MSGANNSHPHTNDFGTAIDIEVIDSVVRHSDLIFCLLTTKENGGLSDYKSSLTTRHRSNWNLCCQVNQDAIVNERVDANVFKAVLFNIPHLMTVNSRCTFTAAIEQKGNNN